MPYKAFISYSHAADGKLAPALQSALQTFAKPWYQRRAVRIFRDATNLAANPGLWSEIVAALGQSEYFLLLASPEATKSKWVTREIEYWLRNKEPKKILIVLTEGELAWNSATGDFDREKTTAIPECLKGRSAEEPHYVDVRRAKKEEHLSLRFPEFGEAVADLASTLHGVDKDMIAGEDLRQHRKTIRLARFVGMIMLVLLITAVFLAILFNQRRIIANQQRNEASRRRLVSIAQALAAYAPREQAAGKNDELAALLARQAFIFNTRARGERLDQVDRALRQVLSTPQFSVALDTGISFKLTSSALSNDGHLLAVGGHGSEVQVWNLLEPGGAPHAFTHRYGYIMALGFNPSADRLVALSQDGYAIVWDIFKSGSPVTAQRLPIHGTTRFTSAVVSADGKRAAYGGEDGRVSVWNLESLEAEPTILCCHDSASRVLAVAFHPKRENIVASGGSDNTVRVWNVAQPITPIKVLRGHDNAVTSVQFSPDGRKIASGTQRGPVWQGNLANLFEDDSKGPEPVAMQGGSVYLWDVQGGTGSKFSGQSGSVTSLAFQPDGDILASAGGGDETVCLWSLTARQQHPVILSGHKGIVAALAFASDGKTLTSVGESDSTVRLWDLRPPVGAAAVLSGQDGAVRALAFSPSSEVLASADGTDAKVRLWDLGKRAVRTNLEQSGSAVAVAYSPKGNLIASSSESGPLDPKPGNSVLLWDPENPDKPIASLNDFQSSVESLSFSSDGGLLASAAKLDQRILIWDVRHPNTAKFSFTTDASNLLAVAFSPEGQKLAWGSNDKKVQVKNLAEPNQDPTVLNVDANSVNSISFGPGQRLLAVGDDMGVVRLWDLQRPQTTRTFTASKQEIFAVAIDSSGQFLAAGGADGRIRVWDLTGSSLDPLVFEGPEKPVYSIAFSPDSRWLAAGGSGKGVFVWPSTKVLQELVCQKVVRNLTPSEWSQFVGADVNYECTCDNLPPCAGKHANSR